LRKHGPTEKLKYEARRIKTVLDQQPQLIESFCQSVQGGCLPDTELESFPLLCAYSLIQWALEGKTEGEGYGFPFDRPHLQFAKRLRIVGQGLEEIKDIHLRGPWEDNKPLFRLSCELKKLSADEGLAKILAVIDQKIQVFDHYVNTRRRPANGPGNMSFLPATFPETPVRVSFEGTIWTRQL
jgi:hypothetical protein